MREDLPNAQQIQVCKEKKRMETIGQAEEIIANYRESEEFALDDCIRSSKNDAMNAISCYERYISEI